jgi:hypothetical protein
MSLYNILKIENYNFQTNLKTQSQSRFRRQVRIKSNKTKKNLILFATFTVNNPYLPFLFEKQNFILYRKAGNQFSNSLVRRSEIKFC